MTTDTLAELLRETTHKLMHAHREHHTSLRAANTAKRDLATAEAKHTLAGLEGKNAEARKAELTNLTTQERRALEAAEEKLDNTRLTLTLAELDARLARDLLKLHTSNLEDNH